MTRRPLAAGPDGQPGVLPERRGVSAAGHRSQILTTRVGLQIPDDLTYEEWERAGTKLVRLADTFIWCLGDWLAHGQNKYGDRYRQAVEKAGLDYQTLRNYAWVARKFRMDRRHPRLSFQHHAEVASLPVEAQDNWLYLAEESNWSRNELRRRLRGVTGTEGPTRMAAVVPRLAVTQEHLQRWREAAALSSSSLETWLVSALNAAAAEVLSGSDPRGPGPA
jgi:hypothetical protein